MEILRCIKIANHNVNGGTCIGENNSFVSLNKNEKTGLIEFEIGCNYYIASIRPKTVFNPNYVGVEKVYSIVWHNNIPQKWVDFLEKKLNTHHII